MDKLKRRRIVTKGGQVNFSLFFDFIDSMAARLKRLEACEKQDLLHLESIDDWLNDHDERMGKARECLDGTINPLCFNVAILTR